MLFCEQLYVRLAPFLGKGIHCYKNNSVEVTFMDNYVEMDNEMDNEKIRCRGILHIVKKGDTLYKSHVCKSICRCIQSADWI